MMIKEWLEHMIKNLRAMQADAAFVLKEVGKIKSACPTVGKARKVHAAKKSGRAK